MAVHTVNYKGEEFTISVSQSYKMNPNQIVIQAFDSNGAPFATLSKGVLESQIMPNENVLDENNVPGVLDLLVDCGLVEDTGYTVDMGFNSYPVVKMKN